jgi:hypothetical protein
MFKRVLQWVPSGEWLNMYKQPNVTRVQSGRVCLCGCVCCRLSANAAMQQDKLHGNQRERTRSATACKLSLLTVLVV